MIKMLEVQDERGMRRFVNIAQIQCVLELKTSAHCEIKFNSGDSLVVAAKYEELCESIWGFVK